MLNVKACDILGEILLERERQEARWGVQTWPSGADAMHAPRANIAREVCDENTADGRVTWLDIAHEEFWEAFSETDPQKRRVELIQLAAVIVAAIEAEDRRAKEANP